MRDTIKFGQGVEVAVIPWVQQVTATSITLNMEGWEWFVLCSIDSGIDNALGAVTAIMTVQTTFNGLSLVRAVSTQGAIAGGASGNYFGLLGEQANVAGVLVLVTLPLIVNPQGSSIVVNFSGGDVGTRIIKGSATVIGSKRSTLKRR